MRLSGFSCLEPFGVAEMPAALAEAVAELPEMLDVSWLQTSLLSLAGDGLEGTTQAGEGHAGQEPRALRW